MRYLFILLTLFTYKHSFSQARSLDEYIEIAKENSPLLKGYRNQVLSNRLDSLLLFASTKTQVNLQSNNYYAPVIHGWGYDEAITNIANVQGIVQASRNLLPQQTLNAQYRAIALQGRALQDTILLSIRDLQKTITDQYITAYGDQLTMNYSRELYDILKREEEALRKLAEASVIKQTEFLAFTITMQQQELTYLQAQIQYNTDFLTLNFLSGIVDTTILQLQEPKLPDNLPHDFYSSVYYRKFITDSLRIANEKTLINLSYRPTISPFADAGYFSSLQNLPYKNFGVSVGVNIRMPVYDAHQKRFKLEKTDIEEQTRQFNKTFYISQYNQQFALLTHQLDATEKLFTKITQQVDYTRTLISAYEKLLQTSDVKVTEFVTAITNYVNAQNAYRQNLVSRLKIMNQLNYWNQ
jgi:hypothetical protein